MDDFQNPYTGTKPQQDYHAVAFASLFGRLVAMIVDIIVVSSLLSVIFRLLGISINLPENATFKQLLEAGKTDQMYTLSIYFNIGLLLYLTLFEASRYSATPGKMLMGIMVTNEYGERLNLQKSFIRNLGKVISNNFLFLGHLSAILSPRLRTLYDIWANTVVIRRAKY